MSSGLRSEFEKWQKERYYALASLVIRLYIDSAGNDNAATLHGMLREILLFSGYPQEALDLWEALETDGGDHAS